MKDLFIYVMERGFVLVGEPVSQDGLFVKLNKCGVIRRWGTTAGLGQLATEGPLSETIIDREPAGTEIKLTAVYRKIPCNMKAWQGKEW